jgi:hypothetical protein
MRSLYLRGLAGPAWAQAASFSAVVVAGLVLGHGAAPRTVSHQAGTTLTVRVTGQPNPGAGQPAAGQFQRAPVAVLQADSLESAATGRLSRSDALVVRVPAGTYAVCVLPPREWRPAHAATAGPAGWACAEATIGKQSAVADLVLTAAADHSAGGRK